MSVRDECRCPTCVDVFASVEDFDAHRSPDGCLIPEKLGMQWTGRAWRLPARSRTALPPDAEVMNLARPNTSP